MPFSARTYATRWFRQLARLAVLVSLTAAPLFARPPGPAIRIPLDSLGFQPQPEQFLLAGSSMITLNYVDNHHLLFTFRVHRLMPRIADDPPDDEDRVIEAVLLETPSGRVLARTDLRLHDNGQYLWSLGHGRFLLRTRDTLTTFAPMANLASGQPFRQRPFLTTTRRIGAVLLSPENDLLIVETAEQMPPVAPSPTPLFGPAPKPTPAPLGRPDDPDPVTLSFYRLSMPAESGNEVTAIVAGTARSITFGALAATGAGHIGVVDEGRQHWAFDFHPYHGQVKELAPFDSICRPRPQFVSNSEFISFGCHSGNAPRVLGGFNMRGEEMWEQNLYGEFAAVSFAFAPSSGRFALERVLGGASADDIAPITPEAFTGQNVVVYQTESGKQLLHVDCSPIARAGQNFALSQDGMGLAVIHAGAIEVYSLPPLSAKDQAEVKEARALVPEPSALPVEFATASATSTASADAGTSSSGSDDTNAASDSSNPAPSKSAAPGVPESARVPVSAPVAATRPASGIAAPTAGSAPSGDAAPEQPRKPPTLYTLPTDAANRESR